MQHYIILAQAECTAKALGVWLEMAGQKSAVEHVEKATEKLRIFDSCREVIGKFSKEERSVVVLIDTLEVGQSLNPCHTGGWDTAIGMLILAFPEVRWLIGLPHGNCDDRGENSKKEHDALMARLSLESLWEEPFDPLYDASGLRQLVLRQTIDKKEQTADTEGQPLLKNILRKKFACALDDESASAHFHAYTAYRFGYRALAVETEHLAYAVLGADNTEGNWKSPDLVLEDLFLNYPDPQSHPRQQSGQNEGIHWSDLRARDEQWPALKEHTEQHSTWRVFVTTGQTHGIKEKVRQENRQQRQELRRQRRLGTFVPKPIAGIFDLWRACGLKRRFRKRHGFVDGFHWPPRLRKETDSNGGHSAPGTLLLIANCLIERANDLVEDVNSAKDAVRGAVMATTALELLADKTPTTALEALSLKHRFEVHAECQFFGVQSHLDVEARMREIRREIQAIGEYFHSSNRNFACWNAEAMILGDLIKIFDDFKQFDESMVMQARARSVHRRLWAKRSMKMFGDQLRWFNPFYVLTAYAHGLLRSLPVFFAVLCLWIAGLGVLYEMNPEAGNVPNRWPRAYQNAVSSFFSVGGPIHEGSATDPTNSSDSHTRANTIIVCLSIVAGAFHLGIFISHVYTIAARK